MRAEIRRHDTYCNNFGAMKPFRSAQLGLHVSDRVELSDPSMISGKEKGWDPFGKGP
jgi:hypothetical protein